MHIVHIIPTLGYGGAERFVAMLAERAPTTERISIILFRDHAPLRALLPAGVDVHIVPKRSKLGFGYTRALAAALQTLAPDVVHTHLFGADVWGTLAARRAGYPSVSTEHGMNTDEGRIKTGLKRYALKYAIYIVAPSAAIARMLASRYRIHAARIVHIRHGIDTARFAESQAHTPSKILMFGRMSIEKGFDIGIRALAANSDQEWSATIVGEGDSLDTLTALAEGLGLAGRITFAPFTDDVPALLTDHDIVLAPSRSEGLSIALLEALTAGTFVIASAVGGIPEIVTDGTTGRLVPAEDVDALAAALKNALSDSSGTTQIRSQARAHALASFDAATMRHAYTKLYQSVVD